MCIAIIKEPNVALPSKQVLKRCWRSNSDGAGYAFLTVEDEWHVVKGLMTWDAFFKSYEEQQFQIGNTVLIHFRVGTSGKRVGGKCFSGCTHPFPISDEYDELMAETYTTKSIVIHNGVHSRPTGDLSDSQLAVKDVIYPLMPYMRDENIKRLFSRLLWGVYEKTANRWLVCDGPTMYKIGNWITDEKTGLIYSNDGYKPSTVLWDRYSEQRAAVHSWLVGTANKAKGTVIIKAGREAFEFCAGGHWSWAKWDKQFADTLPVVVDKTTSDDAPDDIRGIYDEQGNTIGLVDKDGNVIWDDDDVTAEREAVKEAVAESIFQCNECGADLFASQCNGGMCPWCYSVVNPKDTLIDREACPHCGERNHLMDSSFDRGDRECLRCGALFMDTIPGEDGIVGWNQETKEYHDHLKSVMNGGS